MNARVISSQILPAKIDEAIRLYRESALPPTRQQKGFQGAYQLVDRGTGEGLSLTLWDSESDLLASETGGNLREQVAKFAAVLAGPPTTERFEVAVQLTGGPAKAARVIVGQFRPGKTDAGSRHIRELVAPLTREQEGFQGAYFLVDRNTGKYASITLWDTEASLRMADLSRYIPEATRQEFSGMTAGPSTTVIYEVAVRA